MELNEITFHLYKTLDVLDERTRDDFLNSFSQYVFVLNEKKISPSQKKKTMTQLATYLKRKADEVDPESRGRDSISLRKIRNELAHGKYKGDMDFSELYGALWRAIGRLGTLLGPNDVENLLSYSLHVDNLNMASRGVSPAKIVSIYRPVFNALPENLKDRVFVELLLRLFSSPMAMSLLEEGVKK